MFEIRQKAAQVKSEGLTERIERIEKTVAELTGSTEKPDGGDDPKPDDDDDNNNDDPWNF